MAVVQLTDDYKSTRQELSRAIRRCREDCPPGETARLILSYDHPDVVHVVGLPDASRAVLYHCENRRAAAFEFGPEGLNDMGIEVQDFGPGWDIEKWISRTYPDWTWLHPRYR